MPRQAGARFRNWPTDAPSSACVAAGGSNDVVNFWRATVRPACEMPLLADTACQGQVVSSPSPCNALRNQRRAPPPCSPPCNPPAVATGPERARGLLARFGNPRAHCPHRRARRPTPPCARPNWRSHRRLAERCHPPLHPHLTIVNTNPAILLVSHIPTSANRFFSPPDRRLRQCFELPGTTVEVTSRHGPLRRQRRTARHPGRPRPAIAQRRRTRDHARRCSMKLPLPSVQVGDAKNLRRIADPRAPRSSNWRAHGARPQHARRSRRPRR